MSSWSMIRNIALTFGLVAITGCDAEVEADYPQAGYYDYPPDEYVVTTEPIYYEGRATYWYGGRWYYREGGRWGYYNREPAYLSQHRYGAGAMRSGYEHYSARPV